MSDVRVRYRDKPDVVLTVRLIKTWKRGDIPHQILSVSSGPKEYTVNMIFEVFDTDKGIDAVSMVRASGPTFLVIRKGKAYFDVKGKELEVLQKGGKKS